MRDEMDWGQPAHCRNCGIELTGEEGWSRLIENSTAAFCCRECMGEFYQNKEQLI